MSGNTTDGSYRIDPFHNLALYDTLPAALRETIRNALFDYAVPPLATSLKQSGLAAACDSIISADIYLARKYARRDWGGQAADYLSANRSRKRRDWYDAPPKGRNRI